MSGNCTLGIGIYMNLYCSGVGRSGPIGPSANARCKRLSSASNKGQFQLAWPYFNQTVLGRKSLRKVVVLAARIPWRKKTVSYKWEAKFWYHPIFPSWKFEEVYSCILLISSYVQIYIKVQIWFRSEGVAKGFRRHVSKSSCCSSSPWPQHRWSEIHQVNLEALPAHPHVSTIQICNFQQRDMPIYSLMPNDPVDVNNELIW